MFFGPITAPGRPTASSPWKIFLLIEGSGLRIKLAGDVIVAEDGTVSNVFLNQPELPFGELKLRLNGGDHAPFVNPDTCGTHNGHATLTGWNDEDPAPRVHSFPRDRQELPAGRAALRAERRRGHRDAQDRRRQLGLQDRHLTSRRHKNIKNIKLSLPAGAVGSLAAVPKCQLSDARAGNCPADTSVGTVKNTVGFTEGSALTAEGGLFLAEASQPGDAASIVIDVPAKSGPIDLGDVILISRVVLRSSDTGVDVFTNDIPKIFGGVPLPLRKIEITVDRPGFFLNPTGCEPRPLIATFDAWEGGQSSSSQMLSAEDCDKLPFDPKLRLIAGARGLTGKGEHPPLTAIVTQQPGEANIKLSKTVLPDILRPELARAERARRTVLGGPVRGPPVPGRLAGRQRTRDHARAALRALGPGLHRPGDRRPAAAPVRAAARRRLRGASEGAQLLRGHPHRDAVRQHAAGRAQQLLRAQHRRRAERDPEQLDRPLQVLTAAYNARFTGQNGKTVDSKPLLEVNGCDDPRSVLLG